MSTLPSASSPLRRARALFPIAAFFLDRLPFGMLSELGAPMADHPPVSEIHLIWNPDNVDADVARAVAANATNDTAANVMRLLVDAGAQRGHVQANDFSMEYRHLDLLLHPRAPGEIYPLIEDWLASQPGNKTYSSK